MQIKYSFIASSKSKSIEIDNEISAPNTEKRNVPPGNKKRNPEFCVFKCNRDDVGIVRASLTFLTQIDGKRVYARVMSVNGSPRLCRMAVIKYWKNTYGGSSSMPATYMEDSILPSIG